MATHTIRTLAAEFARLDAAAAPAYAGFEADPDQWPTVGFVAGDGGHAVVSVHPDDIAAAVTALRRFADGAANATGPAARDYDPPAAFAAAGVRCRWHV